MLQQSRHTSNSLRLFAVLIFALLLPYAPGASGDITLHGGSDVQRDRISSLLDANWQSDQLGAVDLAITLGAASLEQYCANDATQPVLALYLYGSRFREAITQCEQHVEAIFVDAPVVFQTRLAQSLFPGARTAMFGHSSGERIPGGAPTALADWVLAMPAGGVARGLGRLLDTDRWRAFLLPVDGTVYQATDYRLIIETLLRQRRPTIVSVRSLLPQGAAAAAYYSSKEIEAALVRTIDALMNTGKLVGRRPERVTVEINTAVMKNFFGRVVSEQERRAIEEGVNGG